MYAIPSDTLLDEEMMVRIWAAGYSRVPVYEHSSADEGCEQGGGYVDIHRISGIMLARQLIVVNPEECRPLSTLPLSVPACISPSTNLVDLINLFQERGGRGRGGMHLALVCARPVLASAALAKGEAVPKEAGVVGIITLEDVIEELLQEEIYDETDKDLERARWGWNKWVQYVKRRKAMKLARGGRSGTVSGASEDTPLFPKYHEKAGI